MPPKVVKKVENIGVNLSFSLKKHPYTLPHNIFIPIPSFHSKSPSPNKKKTNNTHSCYSLTHLHLLHFFPSIFSLPSSQVFFQQLKKLSPHPYFLFLTPWLFCFISSMFLFTSCTPIFVNHTPYFYSYFVLMPIFVYFYYKS